MSKPMDVDDDPNLDRLLIMLEIAWASVKDKRPSASAGEREMLSGVGVSCSTSRVKSRAWADEDNSLGESDVHICRVGSFPNVRSVVALALAGARPDDKSYKPRTGPCGLNGGVMSISNVPERMGWWIEARFGMFIHWGLYAVPARGEWVMYCERIPKAEYAHLAEKFRPARFKAKEWVGLAKEAGMRYMVLTTRHHDGFCLWNSGVSDFTSVKGAAKRDFVAEYVEACRSAGMRVGFYYSLLDWRWPAYWDGPQKDPEGWSRLREYVHAQVRELMTNYGKIDILWYDGGWPHKPEDWQSERLNSMVRSLQPGIVINNRSGIPEDLETPEQNIQNYERPWESCMTIDDIWWGYHAGDGNLKSTMQLVRNLVRCVSGNGNFLLNVGPKADGTIPAAFATRLRGIGRWLRKNADSVYGSGMAPVSASHLGYVTAKGNTVYVHVMFWPGKEMCVAGIKNTVLRAYMLTTKKKLPFKQEGDRLFVRGLPAQAPDRIDTVVALELEGTPENAPASFWK